jgi:hypothetical protein
MYTDPGAGLFFTQLLAAAGLTMIYRFRRALNALLRRRRGPDSDSGT